MRLLLCVLLFALAACPRGPGATLPDRPRPDDLAALRIPAPDGVAAALARLEAAARAGDQAAAWARAHYLMDLFDDARFGRDDASLGVVHRALGLPGEPARGAEATTAVAQALARELDHVLGLDRLHGPAQAARTVLDLELRPPGSRAGLYARMAAVRAVAQGGGPMAASATLRLAAWCGQALRDAPRARYAERPRVLAHCLYALYEADPEPYFATSAERRPPPPRWRDLAERALSELAGVTEGRLARAAARYRAELDAALADLAADMPILPDARALRVPVAQAAALHDLTPLVAPGEPGSVDPADAEALRRAIVGDGRGALAVAWTAGTPGGRLLELAAAARAAGADRLELGVAVEQALRVPRGDYWFGRMAGNSITRLGVIPLSLAVLDGKASARTASWDPDRAGLGLVLELSRTRWRLTSPRGEVAILPAGPGAVDELRIRLVRIRDAFPEEDALVLVPGADASVADLARAAEAALRDGQGRALMRHLALGRAAPAGSGNLAQRIARRAGAAVRIAPEPLAIRAPVVRRCYQEFLEKTPGQRARLRFELHGDAIVMVESTRHRDLNACVSEAVSAAMQASQMASAEIVLEPGS